MRLKPGVQAPDFVGDSLTGRRLSLRDFRGQPLLLKWLPDWPSAPPRVRSKGRVEAEIERELPIDIAPDPDKSAFHAYGIEASWAGMFAYEVARDYVRAMRRG